MLSNRNLRKFVVIEPEPLNITLERLFRTGTTSMKKVYISLLNLNVVFELGYLIYVAFEPEPLEPIVFEPEPVI